MHKREFVMVFIGFFTCLGLAIFIGVAGMFIIIIKFINSVRIYFEGPPITKTDKLDGMTLLPNDSRKNIATGPFAMRSPKMSTYCQQLWVIAKLYTENTDGKLHFIYILFLCFISTIACDCNYYAIYLNIRFIS